MFPIKHPFNPYGTSVDETHHERCVCFERCTRLGLMLNSKTPNCAKKNPQQTHSNSAQMVVRNGRISRDVSTTMRCTAPTKCYLPKNCNKITSEKRVENIWMRKRGIWEIAHLSVISCKKGTLWVDKLSSNMLMFIGPADCRMVDCWSSQSQSNLWLCGDRFRTFILHLTQSKFHFHYYISHYRQK